MDYIDKTFARQQKNIVKQQCGIISKHVSTIKNSEVSAPKWNDLKMVEKKLDEIIKFLNIQ